MEPITVAVTVDAPIGQVWQSFTNPSEVVKWNAASPDWHSPQAENDLRVGGKFNYRMEAKDGSTGFDFEGTYTAVEPQESFSYVLEDGRQIKVTFKVMEGGVEVVEIFDPETENPVEMQRAGWQAILDNFKSYVEGKGK